MTSSSSGLLLAATAVLILGAGCGRSVEVPVVSPTTAGASATEAAAVGQTGAVAGAATSSRSPAAGASPSGTGRSGATGGTAEFVAVVHASAPEVAAGRTDAEIAAIGTTACDGLRQGTDAETIVSTAKTLNTLDAEATDDATARELVKLAIDTLCLDQAARIDEFRPA